MKNEVILYTILTYYTKYAILIYLYQVLRKRGVKNFVKDLSKLELSIFDRANKKIMIDLETKTFIKHNHLKSNDYYHIIRKAQSEVLIDVRNIVNNENRCIRNYLEYNCDLYLNHRIELKQKYASYF
jgi:hypothetical protein